MLGRSPSPESCVESGGEGVGLEAGLFTFRGASLHACRHPGHPNPSLHQAYPVPRAFIAAVSRGLRELADGAGAGPEVGAGVGTLPKPAPDVLPGSSPRSPRQRLTQGLRLGPAVTQGSRWPPAQPDCRAVHRHMLVGRGGERGSARLCRGARRKFWVPGLRQGAGDPTSGWKDDRVLGAQRRPGSLAPSPAPPFPAFWVLTHNLGTPAVKGAPNASAPA